MKYEIADTKLTVDMGYRGSMDLTIRFIDQNNIDHEQTFEFRVFGEKPTCLTIAKARTEPELLFTMTERD
jgi:recombinational DNA repair protein RecT